MEERGSCPNICHLSFLVVLNYVKFNLRWLVDTNATYRDEWNGFSHLSSHIGPALKSLQNYITSIVSTDKKLKSKR